jgi:hypothetical protein
MQAQSDFVKTALRLPPQLHQLIHQSAKKHQRSYNAEILYRLGETYQELPKAVAQ